LPAFHGREDARAHGAHAGARGARGGRWPAGEPFELHPRFQALTLEIILRAVFGFGVGGRLEALKERVTEILDFGTSFASVNQHLWRSFAGRGPWARFVRAREAADELVYTQIDERRRSDEHRDDILSMLLEARHEDGSEMTREEIRDELMTALVAGHETTASELAWAFERRAREPRVVRRLHEEIDAREGDEYLTATINETFRRRPVLPQAEPRLVKKPITVGDWGNEPGVVLAASAWLVHHDPEIYRDPYAFRPRAIPRRAPQRLHPITRVQAG